MTESNVLEPKRRNKNYEDTHRVLIEKAVELISESGADAVSVSALARATRINRSTVYYHFDSREALIAAVRKWSSEELAKGVNPEAARRAGVDHISSFVLRNPEIIKLWIDDYIAAGDIRQRYPQWDSLVADIAQAFAEQAPDEICDAEVYCALMLTSAFIAPRVFKNSVRPHETVERVVERFTREQQRMLQREGIMATWIDSGDTKSVPHIPLPLKSPLPLNSPLPLKNPLPLKSPAALKNTVPLKNLLPAKSRLPL